MNQVMFSGRILLLGYGGVARCTLPLLLRHLAMPPGQITVLDMAEFGPVSEEALAQGVRFERARITRRNLEHEILSRIGSGDLLVDLAWNISCVELLTLCRRNNIRYINTSVELWDPYAGAELLPPSDKTLYVRHMEIRELVRNWGNNSGPTAVLDHGANPGLVSHFTKRGLIDIAQKLRDEHPADPRLPSIDLAQEQRQFNELARLLGVKVIHVSEVDTQVGRLPRRYGEFLNTWSVEGFYEESIAPAEMGWGSHERRLPFDAHTHDTGPRNQICLDRFGMDTFVRSRVPSGEMTGMIIRHGEAFSISDYLSVCDDAGRVLYRPTVHYAYCPCDAALESIEELRENGYPPPSDWRIMSDELVSGRDELGCLLMGHDFKSWWTGTILDLAESRELVPAQNATTLQVASSVVAAVMWMLRNPRSGVRLPDELPFDEILDFAAPYLGQIVSQPIDWMPEEPRGSRARLPVTHDAHWQFARFEVPEPPQPSRRTSPRTGRSATSRTIPTSEREIVPAGVVQPHGSKSESIPTDLPAEG